MFIKRAIEKELLLWNLSHPTFTGVSLTDSGPKASFAVDVDWPRLDISCLRFCTGVAAFSLFFFKTDVVKENTVNPKELVEIHEAPSIPFPLSSCWWIWVWLYLPLLH